MIRFADCIRHNECCSCYGDGIELLSPERVRESYLREVRKMLSAYPEYE